MRTKESCLVLALAVVLDLGAAQSQTLIPTNEWVNFWSDSSLIDNNPLPVGVVVKAYDPQGILCGQCIVATAGSYGFMPVYRDDPTTSTDEGAIPGDTIRLTVNGLPVEIDGGVAPIWTANGDVRKITFKADGSEIALDSGTLTFGAVPLKTTATKTLIVKNKGLKPLVIDSISSDYHFQSHFSFSQTSATINPGDSLLLSVEFSPLLGSGNVHAQIDIYSNAWNWPTYSVPMTAMIQTDIRPTNEWISFWGDSTLIDNRTVMPGDVVDAYDPQGVHCGTFTVTAPKKYGVMAVYFDDLTTPAVDEGVSVGDRISFMVNGYNAYSTGPGKPVCTANGSVLKVNLHGLNDGAPAPFSLASPIDFAKLDSDETTPTFRWTKSTDPDKGDSIRYQLNYSLDSLMTKSLVEINVKDTFYMVPSSSPLKKHTRYYWTLSALDLKNFPTYGSGTDIQPWWFDVGTIVSVDQVGSGFPEGFALYQNYPNPFNPSTLIGYELPVNGFVSLKVFDVLGRELNTLVNEVKARGRYEIKFDGAGLPSGIYFYQMTSGAFRQTKAMVLLK